MTTQKGKIPKACDPCRRRKTRCDGQRPCLNCQDEPSVCSYRLKARVRRTGRPRDHLTKSASPAGPSRIVSVVLPEQQRSEPPDTSTSVGLRDADVLGSVRNGVVATDLDDSQVYYSPFTSYALAQHIRRIVLQQAAPRPVAAADDSTAQDVGMVLDLFMQRHLFFGPPPQSDFFAAPLLYGPGGIVNVTPRAMAEVFLDNFKVATLNILPFFTVCELDWLLGKLYEGADDDIDFPPQKRALLLVVLASGALSHADTSQAETLFFMAKQQNMLQEDVISLETIQFALLAADYSINMGRATSAYLSIGVACRKAFVMGLTGTPHMSSRQEAQAKQWRVTIWSLYFMDCWYSIMGGRKRMIVAGDIACEHPKDHALLTSLCQLVGFLEDISDLINEKRPRRLQDLYRAADSVHSRLRQWADGAGIGTAAAASWSSASQGMAALTLHNAYFQILQFLFRPFMIAEYGLPSSSKETSELWLRHACRHATDAALDGIVSFQSLFSTLDKQKLRRRDAYFLETSCSLLLLESLRHPSKHSNNAVYIDSAITILGKMPADVPVTSLLHSIQKIAAAVESFIASRREQHMSRSSIAEVQSRFDSELDAAESLGPYQGTLGDEELQRVVADHPSVEEESFLSSLSQEELTVMIPEPFDFSMF